MPKKKGDKPSRTTDSEKECCCKIEVVLSVGERGQMVLPKDIRSKAKIRTGDKLALVSWLKEGEVCCMSLFKVDALASSVQDLLEPLLRGNVNK